MRCPTLLVISYCYLFQTAVPPIGGGICRQAEPFRSAPPCSCLPPCHLSRTRSFEHWRILANAECHGSAVISQRAQRNKQTHLRTKQETRTFISKPTQPHHPPPPTPRSNRQRPLAVVLLLLLYTQRHQRRSRG